jgi:uncharacterized membrane protein YfcA
MTEIALYILAGAGVGFAIGVTGVGGGSLMTPLLLLFGFPAPVAVGTDLLYAALTKAGAVVSHHRRGNVDWRIVGTLAAGSLPTSVLLHFLLRQSGFHEQEGFGELLTRCLGFMLIVTAIVLLIRDKYRLVSAASAAGNLVAVIHRNQSLSTFAMGIVLGLCVTLSSVGAGAFGAALLLVIYVSTPAIRIIATDVAHAVPLTLIAGLGYLVGGYVDGLLLISLLAGSLPAIQLGTYVSSNVPERVLQRLLIALLLALGANYTFL